MTALIVVGVILGYLGLGLLTVKFVVHFDILDMGWSLDEDEPMTYFVLVLWPIFLTISIFVFLFRFVGPLIRWATK